MTTAAQMKTALGLTIGGIYNDNYSANENGTRTNR